MIGLGEHDLKHRIDNAFVVRLDAAGQNCGSKRASLKVWAGGASLFFSP